MTPTACIYPAIFKTAPTVPEGPPSSDRSASERGERARGPCVVKDPKTRGYRSRKYRPAGRTGQKRPSRPFDLGSGLRARHRPDCRTRHEDLSHARTTEKG
ncbi:hypothetical protein HPB50_012032 [Hyalomma asiaticum]|uniref:Uncharacterized protein n=1 Tax=Hyalomma asiaticum TaxID=266040 RepID=A0ACB7S5L2_HYAAI|nr:hypothetical protein HPB50_012032 [Hyalomma asiaticum]